MDAGSYTNCGEEVPLGVECALPCRAGSSLHDEAILSAPVECDRGSGIDTIGPDPA